MSYCDDVTELPNKTTCLGCKIKCPDFNPDSDYEAENVT